MSVLVGAEAFGAAAAEYADGEHKEKPQYADGTLRRDGQLADARDQLLSCPRGCVLLADNSQPVSQ